MAERPIKDALPADLPENWQAEQIVAPTGEEVGLSHQHGYNYLMEMVNRAQRGVNSVNEAFESVSGKRTCRFVVGTSTAGWTAADCDYLCDGTDDQVEIQAAIDSLPKESGNYGGEVVLLSGTYHLNGSITLLENVVLRGNGESTCLERKTKDGTSTVKWVIGLGRDCVLSDLEYKEGTELDTEGYPNLLGGTSAIRNVNIYRSGAVSGGCIYVSLAKNASNGRFAEVSGCHLSSLGGTEGEIHLASGGDVRILNNITIGDLITSDPDCGVHLIARGNSSALGSFYTGIHVDGLSVGSMILENDLDHLSVLNTNSTFAGRFQGSKCLVSGNVFRTADPSTEPAVILGTNTSEIFVTGNLFCNKDAPAYSVQDNGSGNIVRFNSNDLTGSGGTPTTVAQAVPSISVAEGGLVTASATQTAGNVAAGTKSTTHQLSAQDDPNLVPENIREGVSIFGVQGAMQAGTGGVTSETVAVIVTLTETEYNALSAKDPATLYLIKE